MLTQRKMTEQSSKAECKSKASTLMQETSFGMQKVQLCFNTISVCLLISSNKFKPKPKIT